jgi:cytochrome c oxidase subunit III
MRSLGQFQVWLPPVFDRYADRRVTLAVHFFLLTVAVFLVSALLGWRMIESSRSSPPPDLSFPRAFWLSSVALLTGSIALERSLSFVRRERQRAFRTQLIVGLLAGVLFVAFQIYGMWELLRSREVLFAEATDEISAALGAKPYIFVAAFLHAAHFAVALMFLSYVTLNGLGGRYDHEYFWGVQVCAWFWHALGFLWLAIVLLLLVIVG